mmetsp:Transcript_33085/g.37562  ORF Transcript_33085/g.37562 Transcript_33085/m.37562 type:complete len:147 (+) Transcript_33085:457-897(+)
MLINLREVEPSLSSLTSGISPSFFNIPVFFPPPKGFEVLKSSNSESFAQIRTVFSLRYEFLSRLSCDLHLRHQVSGRRSYEDISLDSFVKRLSRRRFTPTSSQDRKTYFEYRIPLPRRFFCYSEYQIICYLSKSINNLADDQSMSG